MGQWLIDGGAKRGISPDDRGLAYGDGLFETIALREGTPRLLDRHLERLTRGCDRLGIQMPEVALIRSEIGRLTAGHRQGTVKIIITRGSGRRGYAPPVDSRPTRAIAFWPEPGTGAARPQMLEKVIACSTPASCNPVLAGLKTLNRLDNVLARAELRASAAREGIMSDTQGHIIGGTRSNLFLVREGRLLTPVLNQCGIRGVMRGLVLELAVAEGIEVIEADIGPAEIAVAEELFVTNALIGLEPILNWSGRTLGVGPVTREIARILLVNGIAECEL